MLQRRVLGIILAGFAMVLIVIAVLPRGWWRAEYRDDHIHIGLRSVEVCNQRGDDELGDSRTFCRESLLDAMVREADDEADRFQGVRPGDDLGAFATAGSLLLGGGLIAAALLGLGAVLAFHSRERRLPRALTTSITLAAAGFGALTLVFLLLRPDGFVAIPYGPSPILALAGAVIGVIGGRCLAIYEPSFEPQRRPVVPGSPVIALALVGVGAVLAIASTTIAPWWSHPGRGQGAAVAPRWVELCDDDACKTASLVAAAPELGRDGQKFFLQVGALIFHLSLLALVIALLGLALAVAGQPVTGGLSPARWLLVLGAVFLTCTMLFLGSRPETFGEFDLSWGPPIAVLGGLGLLVGGGLLGRWVPPAPDPLAYRDLAGPSIERAAGAAVPACPTCRAPMAWASTHRRFFCATCRVYV